MEPLAQIAERLNLNHGNARDRERYYDFLFFGLKVRVYEAQASIESRKKMDLGRISYQVL